MEVTSSDLQLLEQRTFARHTSTGAPDWRHDE
jgi:hypothetical protein